MSPYPHGFSHGALATQKIGKAVAGGYYGNSGEEKAHLLEDSQAWAKRGYLITTSMNNDNVKLEPHENDCKNRLRNKKDLTLMELDKKTLDSIDNILPWSVYIARCSDGTLYCGISNNVMKRIDDHNKGKGAKYTRSRLPVTLVYSEEIGPMSGAMRRERHIKKMTRRQKNDLIDSL